MEKTLEKVLAVLLVLGFLACVALATTNEVVLEWDAPTTNADGTPLTDLAGYKVYMSRIAGGPYTLLATLPVVPTEYDAIIHGSDTDEGNTVRFYFVCTAFDDKDKNQDGSPREPNESIYSNEVYKDLTFPWNTPAPVILRIRIQ